MTIPGKVYVRYLDAIHPSEVASREEMSRLVRRRMLEALLDTPADTCAPMTVTQRCLNVLSIVASLLVVIGFTRLILRFLTLDLHLSAAMIGVGFVVFNVIMTASIIVYYFYIMPKKVMSKKDSSKMS